MVDMAKKWGCRFRCSGELFPSLSGDAGPLKYRLSARTLIEEEMSSENTRKIWERISLRHKSKQDELADKLYVCGAGSSGFYITAGGWLLPCMVATNTMEYNIQDSDFATGWKQMLPLRDRILAAGSPCVSCGIRSACQPCPEKLAMESGKEGIPTAFHCELARCRNMFLKSRMQNER
jgi:radical SAM protein with 4Fe4S-binding SPASM domain